MEQIELLTVEQLCRILQIGKNTAYKLIQTGEIKGFRVGRSWKIPRDSIDEYLNFKSRTVLTYESEKKLKTFAKKRGPNRSEK